MFDVLHFRARCKDRQKVKGGDGQRKEKGSRRQIQPFLTKSMSLKTMTTKPCWICSTSVMKDQNHQKCVCTQLIPLPGQSLCLAWKLCFSISDGASLHLCNRQWRSCYGWKRWAIEPLLNWKTKLKSTSATAIIQASQAYVQFIKFC